MAIFDDSEVSRRSLIRIIIALLVGVYFLWCVMKPDQWRLIDGVNLFVHEAGHPIFSPFGEFISIAGGTIMQLIMPAAFVGYFIYHGDRFSAALTLNWIGESLLNISVYAADAAAMQLPLVGNGDRIHDWNYMLTSLGMLNATPRIAFLIRMLGSLTIICAFAAALYYSRPPAESKLN